MVARWHSFRVTSKTSLFLAGQRLRRAQWHQVPCRRVVLSLSSAIARERTYLLAWEAGYIPMSGQIIDASLVTAPKQRNTDGEKKAIKRAGDSRSGRQTRRSCARRTATPAGRWCLARFAFARTGQARQHHHPGLREVSRQHQPLWPHSQMGRHRCRPAWRPVAAARPARWLQHRRACRSSANEPFVEQHGFRSQSHNRKPKGWSMPSTSSHTGRNQGAYASARSTSSAPV